jgi:uncharacterized protein (TIGR02118 family)
MIKVSVLYPNRPGSKFDIDYYCSKHIPMVREKLGPACKGMAVEHGIAGMAPDSAPAYIAMGHIYSESAETFQAAFAPHAQEIMGDIPNYTDIEPVIQISDVRI